MAPFPYISIHYPSLSRSPEVPVLKMFYPDNADEYLAQDTQCHLHLVGFTFNFITSHVPSHSIASTRFVAQF
jgi:hypothetical protein